MELMINIGLKELPEQIRYTDKIFLIGSCFTEHIGNSLMHLKFSILQNPNGILFDPASVCNSLISYIGNQTYSEVDLFQHNELWQSWHHHSRFSNLDKVQVLDKINQSQKKAHEFLEEADWLIVTLGSSFSYRLTELGKNSVSASPDEIYSVANCHRAPAQWFNKHLLSIEETSAMLDNCIHRLFQFNKKLKLIFTISPVRHIRDGVVENNRSKARLIEAVHHLVNKFDRLFYFPAYELVIDVLRDYRFYDIDLVHPNYSATEFVLEKFGETCVDETTRALMKELKSISIARRHKPFQPGTQAHQQFLQTQYTKAMSLQTRYPYLDLREELDYFSKGMTQHG